MCIIYCLFVTVGEAMLWPVATFFGASLIFGRIYVKIISAASRLLVQK